MAEKDFESAEKGRDSEPPDPTPDIANEAPVERQATTNEVYSVFTVPQKRLIIAAASLTAFFSPLSSSIYMPALNTIASDLNVSPTQINLSVTTYLIVQGVAPMMIAGFSDNAGRRLAYIICFVIYLAANLGLALQNNYAALMVLRCLQSGGSSGTVALANGVVGDLVTSAERGLYIGYASLGSVLGPTLSPIIGGLLSQYAGWHWIFWFLLIFAGVFSVPLILFLPETCRKVVGDGSVPPPALSMSLTDVIRHRNRVEAGYVVDVDKQAEIHKNYKIRVPNPLSTLVVVADKESGLILLSAGFALACFYAISTGASSQFKEVYGFSDIQIALMFIPIGAGGMVSALSTGKLVDWNYRRHAKMNGFPVEKNKLQDLTDFPIETARLQVGLPLFYIGAATVIGYGWMMESKVSLAGPVILLLILGYSLTGAFQVLNILMVDIYPGKPATATAASNLVRCELGAAASAVIVPMTNAMGQGWAYTLLALLFVAYSPALLLTMKYGPRWRRAKKEKKEKKAKQQQAIQVEKNAVAAGS
ncbi:major facilitator superfamily domain-containing protein [Lipomyces kononenkoae]|uniref:Major facilitator superfamily domain-containing protein n=1 Tax=Lipomyces kononenkoae TaxID=34357 RepID=A0ACC3T0P3_LIPKO